MRKPIKGKQIDCKKLEFLTDGENIEVLKEIPIAHKKYLWDLLKDFKNIYQRNQFSFRSRRLNGMGYNTKVFDIVYLKHSVDEYKSKKGGE